MLDNLILIDEESGELIVSEDPQFENQLDLFFMYSSYFSLQDNLKALPIVMNVVESDRYGDLYMYVRTLKQLNMDQGSMVFRDALINSPNFDLKRYFDICNRAIARTADSIWDGELTIALGELKSILFEAYKGMNSIHHPVDF